jgi:hypothetical protein
MNDERVFRLLAETNPVPTIDSVGVPGALGEIDRGRATMTTTTTSPERGTRRRYRGPLVAIAAALVVLVAGVAVWATTRGGDELASQPGLSSVTAAYEAMNNGNLDKFYAQLTDRAVQADDHEYRSLEVAMHEQTELLGPCRALEPSPTSGEDRIQCDVRFTDDFFRPAHIWTEVTDTFVMADNGKIDVIVNVLGDTAAATDYTHAFWRWMHETYPEVYSSVWEATPDPDSIPAVAAFAHRDAALAARDHVDEFIAQSSDYPLTKAE